MNSVPGYMKAAVFW